MVSIKLPEACHNVAIDTNIFIYVIEQHPQFGAPAKQLLQLIESGQVSACASVITMTELLVKPAREEEKSLMKKYKLLFHHFPHLTLLPIHATTAERAALLRAKYTIPVPDALIISCAIEGKSDILITDDRRLSKVTEISCLSLSEIMA